MQSAPILRWGSLHCVAGFVAVVLLASCSDDPSSNPNNSTSTNSDVVADPFEGLSERDPGDPEGPTELEPDNTPIGPDDPFCTQDCSMLDDQCVIGICGEDGQCATEARADGTECDDDDLCTFDDRCVAGECVSAPIVCEAEACNTAACDPDTGECATTWEPDGTACESGDICVIGECRTGTCTGGVELDCSATPTDQCSYAVCDRQFGCIAAPATGSTCDDGDACTFGDRCDDQAGCVGTPVDCAAQAGPCQTAVCDSGMGDCVFTDVADGTACDDGDACTESDSCTAGLCGGSLRDCGADQCNRAACDPVNGCSLMPIVGALCDDGDACTGPDVCDDAGACVGAEIPNPPLSCP